MPFAQNSRHDISYVAETVYGTTPGSPVMKMLRYTGGAPNLMKDVITTSEIRSDRGISDVRHDTRKVEGSLEFELSAGAYDDFLEAAMMGTWASNVLKAGTTQRSFTLERRFNDLPQFLRYTGINIGGFSMSIKPAAMITGAFSLVGKGFNSAGTTLAAPTAAPTNPVMSQAQGTITENAIVQAIVTGVDFSLDNGLDANFIVGSTDNQQISYGRSNITGTITAYFQDLTLLNKFVNETESSLIVNLADTGSKSYNFTFPRIKYTGGEIPSTGEGSVVVTLPFQALRDSTAGTNLTITRVP